MRPYTAHVEETPKIHIDADWKAEAQKEKERLAAEEKSKSKETGGGKGPSDLPEPSFQALLGILASQALMGLGTMVDPQSRGVVIDLEGSRFSIDLLEMLEEKTKGNLSEDEASELRQVLNELRARFVQVSRLVAQQAASGNLKTPESAGAGGKGVGTE